MLRGQSAEFWWPSRSWHRHFGAETSPWRCRSAPRHWTLLCRQAMSPRWRVVLGRMTSALPSYRSVFGDAPSDILRVFRINRNDPLIQDGTVSILHGNSSVIALTIRDRPGVQALCAFLRGSSAELLTMSPRASREFKLSARLSLNNQQLSGDSQSESELKSGENFVLGCSGVGSGGGRLSVRLEKSGKPTRHSKKRPIAFINIRRLLTAAGVA
uniref:ACT domain-containing protein n=1 Tax=Macrostomum lignano TaxID=282301 RepID=A0A1I8FC19_9PLAT